MKHKLLIIMIIFSVFVAGCQNQVINKQQQGGAIGSTLGAILGYQLGGSDKEKRMYAMLGGLIGAYLGQSIGASLDEKDRAALLDQTNRVLNQQGGGNATWESATTGANAKITTSASREVSQQVNLVKVKQVVPSAAMHLIGQVYQANVSANVRFAPSKGAGISGGLQPGETFTAVGRTENNWIMVAKQNVTIGYVYAPLVDKAKTGAEPQRQAVNLDDVMLNEEDTKQLGINLDTVELEEQIVLMNTECKSLDLDINNQTGKNSKESFEACRGPDGAWEIL